MRNRLLRSKHRLLWSEDGGDLGAGEDYGHENTHFRSTSSTDFLSQTGGRCINTGKTTIQVKDHSMCSVLEIQINPLI